MPRTISLCRISAELRLGNSGITICVTDDNQPQRNGKLRLGRAIHWTDAGKGRRPIRKTWEQLIDFLRS